MGKRIGTVSTDDCVVYDLTEKVWNFRFGIWRRRETGEREIYFCMKKLQATKRANAHQRWCLF